MKRSAKSSQRKAKLGLKGEIKDKKDIQMGKYCEARYEKYKFDDFS